MSNWDEEYALQLEERRAAELELIAAAFEPEEVWMDDPCFGTHRIYRRLLTNNNRDVTSSIPIASFILQVELPDDYPGSAAWTTVLVESSRTSSTVSKAAHDTVPALQRMCHQLAKAMVGSEILLSLFTSAQEWLQDEWPNRVSTMGNDSPSLSEIETSHPTASGKSTRLSESSYQDMRIERRMIFSHHIISKKKRGDILTLSRSLHLTGYMKIGWPGLLLLEGRPQDCQEFFDTIRRWQWQHLVERGREQEELEELGQLQLKRRFDSFEEVANMSVVADHCRSIGLDSLFNSYMKFSPSFQGKRTPAVDTKLYGALIHVDHMNDGKGYRKWLRKSCEKRDVALVIKYCYENVARKNSRPIILVGLVGDQAAVGDVLKRWRTSRVDVDSHNQPCLERMMKVLIEGDLDTGKGNGCLDVGHINAEAQLHVDLGDALELVHAIGGKSWREQLTFLFTR